MSILSTTATQSTLIQEHIPLADKNWFRTGGAARYFCEPKTEQEFAQALIYAREHKLPLFILGSGANTLISDDGFSGLVIRPQITSLSIEQEDTAHAFVRAGAGVTIDQLIKFCLDNQFLGLEELSGIPGTVGGSVFINIHYFEFLLSHFLHSAQVINKNTSEITSVENSWFNFGYDYSRLHEEEFYLISGTFKLTKADTLTTAHARGRSQEITRHRLNRYPQSHTCGSFFRNFHEHEVAHARTPKKLIYVAYYLDKIGVKGELSCGDAIVSHQHANMLVNRGHATTHDIVELARTLQTRLFTEFGILPQAECRFLGFKEYPLLSSPHNQ